MGRKKLPVDQLKKTYLKYETVTCSNCKNEFSRIKRNNTTYVGKRNNACSLACNAALNKSFGCRF